MNERQRVTVREPERESSEKVCKRKNREKHYRVCYFHQTSNGINHHFLKRRKKVRLPLPSGHLSVLSAFAHSPPFCMRNDLYHDEYMGDTDKSRCLSLSPKSS